MKNVLAAIAILSLSIIPVHAKITKLTDDGWEGTLNSSSPKSCLVSKNFKDPNRTSFHFVVLLNWPNTVYLHLTDDGESNFTYSKKHPDDPFRLVSIEEFKDPAIPWNVSIEDPEIGPKPTDRFTITVVGSSENESPLINFYADKAVHFHWGNTNLDDQFTIDMSNVKIWDEYLVNCLKELGAPTP